MDVVCVCMDVCVMYIMVLLYVTPSCLSLTKVFGSARIIHRLQLWTLVWFQAQEREPWAGLARMVVHILQDKSMHVG